MKRHARSVLVLVMALALGSALFLPLFGHTQIARAAPTCDYYIYTSPMTIGQAIQLPAGCIDATTYATLLAQQDSRAKNHSGMQRIYYAKAGVNGALPSSPSQQSISGSPVYMTKTELNAAETQYKQYQTATSSTSSATTSSTSSASSASSASSTSSTAAGGTAAGAAGAAAGSTTGTNDNTNSGNSQQCQEPQGFWSRLLGSVTGTNLVSGIFGTLIAAPINAFTNLIQQLAGVNLPAAVFNIFGSADGNNHSFLYNEPAGGGVFTANQWNVLRNIVFVEDGLAALAFIVVLAVEGIRIAHEGGNPTRRATLYELSTSWITGLLLMSIQLPLMLFIFEINYTLTTGIGHAIGIQPQTGIWSINNDQLFSECAVKDPFIRALLNLFVVIGTFGIILQLILRKMALALMTILGPYAALSLTVRGKRRPFKRWITNTVAFTFQQAAAALILALASVFTNATLGNGETGISLANAFAPLSYSIMSIFRIVLSLAGVIIIGLLIWHGLKLAMYSNNPRERANEISAVTRTCVGGALTLSAWYFGPMLLNTFGLIG